MSEEGNGDSLESRIERLAEANDSQWKSILQTYSGLESRLTRLESNRTVPVSEVFQMARIVVHAAITLFSISLVFVAAVLMWGN